MIKPKKDTERNRKEISLETKLALLKACVFSERLCACETWSMKYTDKDLLKVF